MADVFCKGWARIFAHLEDPKHDFVVSRIRVSNQGSSLFSWFAKQFDCVNGHSIRYVRIIKAGPTAPTKKVPPRICFHQRKRVQCNPTFSSTGDCEEFYDWAASCIGKGSAGDMAAEGWRRVFFRGWAHILAQMEEPKHDFFSLAD